MWAADVSVAQTKAIGSNGASSYSPVFSSSTTAGHGVAVLVKWGDSAGTINLSSVTDSQSNSYTCGSKWRSTTLAFSFGYCIAASVTGGATITVTVTMSATVSDYIGITMVDFSGHSATQPDVSNFGVQGSASTGYTSAAAVTTTVSGDLLISQIISSGSTPSAGTGFTDIGTEGDIYMVVGAAGSYSSLRASAGSQDWAVTTLAIKSSNSGSARRRQPVTQ